MRYMIGSQIGWLALPGIVLIGAAYVWVADRILSRKPEAKPRELQPRQDAPSARRAA